MEQFVSRRPASPSRQPAGGRIRWAVMNTQLNPPLPLETPKGLGLAHFVIDYGPESHLLWVVFLDEGGACWTVPNPEIRIQCNWSLKRRDQAAPVRS